MDQDRSLKDLIRFLDPSGSMSDSDIANVSQKMKFTDVLDLVTLVGKGSESEARDLMANTMSVLPWQRNILAYQRQRSLVALSQSSP